MSQAFIFVLAIILIKKKIKKPLYQILWTQYSNRMTSAEDRNGF